MQRDVGQRDLTRHGWLVSFVDREKINLGNTILVDCPLKVVLFTTNLCNNFVDTGRIAKPSMSAP